MVRQRAASINASGAVALRERRRLRTERREIGFEARIEQIGPLDTGAMKTSPRISFRQADRTAVRRRNATANGFSGNDCPPPNQSSVARPPRPRTNCTGSP
jgi:hypothetical protein